MELNLQFILISLNPKQDFLSQHKHGILGSDIPGHVLVAFKINRNHQLYTLLINVESMNEEHKNVTCFIIHLPQDISTNTHEEGTAMHRFSQ